jgi:hypothetical protein
MTDAIKWLTLVDISDTALRLRQAAHAGPIGKRHSSFALYDLLAECMALAARCCNPEARLELERLIQTEKPSAGKRRYVEKQSDEYILVCRFVFPNGSRAAERSNASRYAHCLREAAKRQIGSASLADFLKNEGGLNALYLTRPLLRTTVTTKAIRLAESAELPKHGEFCLTLRRRADGAFDVMDCSPNSTRHSTTGAPNGTV